MQGSQVLLGEHNYMDNDQPVRINIIIKIFSKSMMEGYLFKKRKCMVTCSLYAYSGRIGPWVGFLNLGHTQSSYSSLNMITKDTVKFLKLVELALIKLNDLHIFGSLTSTFLPSPGEEGHL